MSYLAAYLTIGVALAVGAFSSPQYTSRLSFVEIAAGSLSLVLFWPLYPILLSK